MKRYRLTRAAQDDLIGHLAHLTERSQVAAERLALKLMHEFRFLAEWPGSGRLRPEVTDADVRFWPVGSYLLIYREAVVGVVIVRIVHAKQDLLGVTFHLEESQEGE
jgi:plasmid stabilization system protein ParE